MALVEYKILFEVVLLHDYYLKDSNLPLELPVGYTIQNDFSVSPSPQTIVTLRNYRLLFRRTHTGFVVLVRMDGTQSNIPILATANFELVFSLRLLNPYFLHFSDLPMSAGTDRSYILSNLNNNVSGGLNLLSLPAGAPYMQQADEQVLPLDSEYAGQAPFALFQLSHSASVPAGYQFIDNTNDGQGNPQSIPVSRKYYVRIRNRSTHWRYYFSKGLKFPAAQTFPGFVVEDSGTENGDQIIRQISTANPVPLKNQFQILDGSVLNIAQMPNPEISRFKPDPNNSSKFYSETFL